MINLPIVFLETKFEQSTYTDKLPSGKESVPHKLSEWVGYRQPGYVTVRQEINQSMNFFQLSKEIYNDFR